MRELTCLSRVCLSEQEDERDALHRHQALSGHHDSFRLSTLLAVPPAAVLHDRKNGEMYTFIYNHRFRKSDYIFKAKLIFGYTIIKVRSFSYRYTPLTFNMMYYDVKIKRELSIICFLPREAAPTCWKATLERPEPTWPKAATRRSSAPTWWRPTRTSSKTAWPNRRWTSSWRTVSDFQKCFHLCGFRPFYKPFSS